MISRLRAAYDPLVRSMVITQHLCQKYALSFISWTLQWMLLLQMKYFPCCFAVSLPLHLGELWNYLFSSWYEGTCISCLPPAKVCCVPFDIWSLCPACSWRKSHVELWKCGLLWFMLTSPQKPGLWWDSSRSRVVFKPWTLDDMILCVKFLFPSIMIRALLV